MLLFLPDLRVGPSSRLLEERGSLRRSAPERLRIEAVPRHEPRLTFAALGPLPPPARRGGWRLRLWPARTLAPA